MVRLGDYIKITNGYAFKSSLYSEKGARVIRITNVQKGEIEDQNPKFYPFNLLESLERYKIYEDDILMSLTGNVGRVGRFPKELLPAYINQRICRVESISDQLENDYLYHLFNSNEFENRAMNGSAGIAQLNLSTKWIEEFDIPLPSLKTQKHIAQILDDAAALRDKTKQLLTEYDLLAQSIFLEMFGDPVVNQKDWTVRKLGKLTNLITDGKHGNCNDEQDSGYFFISAKDVRNNKINYINTRQIPRAEFEEVDRRTNLQADDLVMINTGATIGRMAIAQDIPETRKTTFQKSVAVIKTKKEILNPLFLQYVFELRLESFVNKGSGSAIKNLLLSEMRRFEIIVPPINLQNQFTEKIALIEQQKELAQQELKESEDLFNSLLQKAFKGELVPQTA